MLIICPKCFTKFEAPSSLIKKQAQKFKCSACGEVFEERFSDIVELTQKAPETLEETAHSQKPQRDEFSWGPEGSHPVPEEFTPVFEKKKKSYGWIFWLILLMIIAGIGGYGYVNRAHLLQSFPEVEKGMAILKAPDEVQPPVDPLQVYAGAEQAGTKTLASPTIAPQIEDSEASLVNGDSPSMAPVQPILGQQSAPEMLGDGVLPQTTAEDKLNLPAPQVADSTVSPAADKAPVQIKDVVFRLDDTGTGIGRLFVQGIVNNTTEDILSMPVLQAQLYDKDEVLLGVRDLPHTPRSLNGKMAEFFFAEVDQLPTGIVNRVSVVIKGK